MKKLIVFASVLLSAFLFTGCGKEGEILKQVQAANSRLENIESQLNGQKDEEIIKLQRELMDAQIQITALENKTSNTVETDDVYMNLKFPSDGNFYKEAWNQVVFYSDPMCKQGITEEVRFRSYKIDSAYTENGMQIFCLMRDNGQICYCTTSPYLITEGKYNEMYQDEK